MPTSQGNQSVSSMTTWCRACAQFLRTPPRRVVGCGVILGAAVVQRANSRNLASILRLQIGPNNSVDLESPPSAQARAAVVPASSCNARSPGCQCGVLTDPQFTGLRLRMGGLPGTPTKSCSPLRLARRCGVSPAGLIAGPAWIGKRAKAARCYCHLCEATRQRMSRRNARILRRPIEARPARRPHRLDVGRAPENPPDCRRQPAFPDPALSLYNLL